MPRVGIRGRIPIRLGFRKKSTPKLTSRVRPTGVGATFSSYKYRPRKMSFRKRVEKVSPEQYYMFTQGIRSTCSYSKQGSLQTYAHTYADLNAISDNISGYNDTTRVFVKGTKKTIHMTNNALTNVFIDIIQFTYRKTSTSNFGTLWNSGLTDQGSGVDSSYYGTTPFMSTALTQFIRIDKIFTVELAAGRSHRHVANYGMNKEFSRQLLAETSSSGSQAYLAGWTRGCVFILRGEPLNDQTTKTTVVPSSCAVDFVITEEIRYHYGNPTNTAMEFQSTLPLTGVTEYTMNDSTAAATTQVTA